MRVCRIAAILIIQWQGFIVASFSDQVKPPKNLIKDLVTVLWSPLIPHHVSIPLKRHIKYGKEHLLPQYAFSLGAYGL